MRTLLLAIPASLMLAASAASAMPDTSQIEASVTSSLRGSGITGIDVSGLSAHELATLYFIYEGHGENDGKKRFRAQSYLDRVAR